MSKTFTDNSDRDIWYIASAHNNTALTSFMQIIQERLNKSRTLQLLIFNPNGTIFFNKPFNEMHYETVF